MRVHDHTVPITGGSAGTGVALGHVFLERGNQVLAVSRSTAEWLRAATERLPRLQPAAYDVAREDLRNLMSVVPERLGPTDIFLRHINGPRRFSPRMAARRVRRR